MYLTYGREDIVLFAPELWAYKAYRLQIPSIDMDYFLVIPWLWQAGIVSL